MFSTTSHYSIRLVPDTHGMRMMAQDCIQKRIFVARNLRGLEPSFFFFRSRLRLHLVGNGLLLSLSSCAHGSSEIPTSPHLHAFKYDDV